MMKATKARTAPRISKLDEWGIDAIIKVEGVHLNAYLDDMGTWAIGIGMNFYPNGHMVKKGDFLASREQALSLFKRLVKRYESEICLLTTNNLSQWNFNALVSLCLNIGTYALRNSTLIKKVNANPDDPSIAVEFRKLCKVNGKRVPELVKKREMQIKMYFTKDY